MTEELALELAKSLVAEYDLREVWLTVRPNNPTDWEVTADFQDGGGNLMESVNRIKQLVDANTAQGHDAKSTDTAI